MKKTWKVLLCMALIMTMLLGSVAMAAGVPGAASDQGAVGTPLSSSTIFVFTLSIAMREDSAPGPV